MHDYNDDPKNWFVGIVSGDIDLGNDGLFTFDLDIKSERVRKQIVFAGGTLTIKSVRLTAPVQEKTWSVIKRILRNNFPASRFTRISKRTTDMLRIIFPSSDAPLPLTTNQRYSDLINVVDAMELGDKLRDAIWEELKDVPKPVMV